MEIKPVDKSIVDRVVRSVRQETRNKKIAAKADQEIKWQSEREKRDENFRLWREYEARIEKESLEHARRLTSKERGVITKEHAMITAERVVELRRLHAANPTIPNRTLAWQFKISTRLVRKILARRFQ